MFLDWRNAVLKTTEVMQETPSEPKTIKTSTSSEVSCQRGNTAVTFLLLMT
jgi:hypothetical protein